MSGAPRTRIVAIASATSARLPSRRCTKRSGRAVWSMISTAPSRVGAMVRRGTPLTFTHLSWGTPTGRTRIGARARGALAEQLALHDRREALAVMPRDADALDRREVVGRAVAGVLVPVVGGIARGEFPHQPVAHRLGDDARARDREDRKS